MGGKLDWNFKIFQELIFTLLFWYPRCFFGFLALKVCVFFLIKDKQESIDSNKESVQINSKFFQNSLCCVWNKRKENRRELVMCTIPNFSNFSFLSFSFQQVCVYCQIMFYSCRYGFRISVKTLGKLKVFISSR